MYEKSGARAQGFEVFIKNIKERDRVYISRPVTTSSISLANNGHVNLKFRFNFVSSTSTQEL